MMILSISLTGCLGTATAGSPAIDFISAQIEGQTTTSGAMSTETEISPSQTATSTTGTEQDIVEAAIADGRFTTLVSALQAADLVETLKGAGPFTVFAPTDDAFANLPAGTLDGLLADIPTLTDVLLYHVVSGKVMAADVVNLTEADTLLGEPVQISVEDGNFMINDATVILADVEASNGVIHVIDTVLLPPKEVESTETATPTETTTTTSPTTTTTTAATTTSPAVLGGKSVTIEVSVNNFSTVSSIGAMDGDGYIVYYMDELPAGISEISMDGTSGQGGMSMYESTVTSYTWEDVTPGVHIFSVQLMDASGNPLSPPVIAALVITLIPD